MATIKRRLRYGQILFTLTFSNLTVKGRAKNLRGVFLAAIRNHFRISVTLTDRVFSASGLSDIFGALSLNRFGSRVMFFTPGRSILLAYLATSFASDVWQLLIFCSKVTALSQVGSCGPNRKRCGNPYGPIRAVTW